MVEDLDQLEQELLKIGRRELEAEQAIQHLRQRCREAAAAGKLAEADLAWSLFEEVRAEMAGIQAEIVKLEARLYGARRKKRF